MEDAASFGRDRGDNESRFERAVGLSARVFGEAKANSYIDARRKDSFHVNRSKQTIGPELSRDTFSADSLRFCSIFRRKDATADLRLDVRLLDTLSRVIARVSYSKQRIGVHTTRHFNLPCLLLVSAPLLEAV
jgi:hypothetical protein